MEQSAQLVVLLHGIARSPASMAPLERHLRAAGFDTLNLGYPSRRLGLGDLADHVGTRLTASGIWDVYGRVHFVTHSMGGLVAAELLDGVRGEPEASRVGRVVMLAPPLLGSEVADCLAPLPPYRWLYGPAGQALTTAARAARILTPWYELGVIAGTIGWPYLLGSLLLPRPHDGRVAVASTRLPGLADHLVLPLTHSFMPGNRQVWAAVEHFLQQGAFDRPG